MRHAFADFYPHGVVFPFPVSGREALYSGQVFDGFLDLFHAENLITLEGDSGRIDHHNLATAGFTRWR